MAFVSCKKDKIHVVEVTLNKSTLLLGVDQSETLTATVKPDSATNKTVTWKSSAADVASVDASGKVIAVKAGTATITVTTTDGGKMATCAVTVVDAIAVTVTGTYQYNGAAHEPSGANVMVEYGNITLTESADYTLSYSNNTNAGTAIITATGIGDYEGKRSEANFTINPLVTDLSVTISGTYTYNGTPIEPSGTSVTVKDGDVTLTRGVDYTLVYSANTNAGTAIITAAGTGNYAGSSGAENFTIDKFPITVTANNASRSIWEADIELTYTIMPSLFGTDKLSGTLMRDAGTGAGFYDIKQGTLSGNNNYHIANFTNGKFEIYYFRGDGLSAATAYEIGTAAQLAGLAELVNAGNSGFNDRYYKLTADINLNVAPYNTGSGWTPIGIEKQTGFGTDYIGFKGNFDGNSHRVSGLYINNSYLNCAALFGVIHNGVVRNLGVVNVNIRGWQYIGGVAGYVVGSSITNCYTAGNVGGNSNVGGVAGYISSSNVTNCYSTCTVSGGQSVGGIAGSVNMSSVTNCYSTGAISGVYYVGGVAGFVSGIDCSVTNCVALNPSVNGTVGVGRVIGAVISPSTHSNNLAYSGMTISGPPLSDYGTSLNGTDITATQAKTPTTYSNQLGWRFGENNNNPWKIIAGGYTLPILYWQTAAPGVMPWHLQ